MSTIYQYRPEHLFPNANQPRRFFSQESLHELAKDLKQHGMVQPIVATCRDQDAKERIAHLPAGVRDLIDPDLALLMIVAGERRWRAAHMAGLETVPVIVRQLDDAEVFELALAENLTREDMLPLEEARAFAKLQEDRGYSATEIARKYGRSPDFVRGRLALLGLDPDIQALVNGGHIPLTVAVSISRLSSDKQHKVVQLMNEDSLNAMQACFLSDQLYAEQEQGQLFDLGAYMRELAAEEAAKWLAKAQTTADKVKDALSTAVQQLSLPDLKAHAAEVQERIKDLLTPKPGEFELCPGCRFYGSCHKEGDEATLDGKTCFEEAPPTLAELVEFEVEKEKDLDYLIGDRKGKTITDQVKVFVLKVPTCHELLAEVGCEPEKAHNLQVVVKRQDDVLLSLSVAEQQEGTAHIYLDTDFGVGGERWEGITFALEHGHRYWENEIPGGGTLLYQEVEDG